MGIVVRGSGGATYNPLAVGSTNTFGLSPDSYGSLEFNVPPMTAGSPMTAAMTTGTLYGVKCPWRQPSTQALTSVQINVNTSGATLSGSQVGIVDMNGNVLGTASADAAFLGSNYQAIALPISAATMATAAAIAPYVYVALLAVGTTGPILIRSGNATTNQLQWGGSGNKLAFCTLGNLTAQGSIPAGPITMTNNSAMGFSIALGLK